MSNEEYLTLEDELAAARAEVERLSEVAADTHARLAQMEAALTNARAVEDSLKRELVEARDRERTATLKYKDAILATEPWLPADMVAGDTLMEIDESLAQARRTVAQVRQQIDEQAQAGRVPAGAPPRRAPDTATLSPLEKIKLGLYEQRG
jgi:hypothetical protein